MKRIAIMSSGLTVNHLLTFVDNLLNKRSFLTDFSFLIETWCDDSMVEAWRRRSFSDFSPLLVLDLGASSPSKIKQEQKLMILDSQLAQMENQKRKVSLILHRRKSKIVPGLFLFSMSTTSQRYDTRIIWMNMMKRRKREWWYSNGREEEGRWASPENKWEGLFCEDCRRRELSLLARWDERSMSLFSKFTCSKAS